MDAAALGERVRSRLPDAVVARGEVTVTVDRAELVSALEFLRDEPDLRLGFFCDVTATDWPDRNPRFWLAYHLYSSEHRHRLRVSTGVPDHDPTVPSIVGMYPGANWYEREVFDMFGIRFEGHPDLQRILMPDDWEGHPLRKDYALGGVGTWYRGGAFIPPVEERGQ